MQGPTLTNTCKIRLVLQIAGIFQLILSFLISTYLWIVFITQEWQLGLVFESKLPSRLAITPMDCMCIAIVLTIQILAVPMALCLFYGAHNQNTRYLKNWIYFAVHSSIVNAMATIVQWAGAAGSFYWHSVVLFMVLIVEQLWIKVVQLQVNAIEAYEETINQSINISVKRNYLRNILSFKNGNAVDLGV